MARQVSYEDLVAVARAQRGRLLPTVGGRAKFSVDVRAGVIYCTPSSSGKPRRLGGDLAAALNHYNRTGSRRPSDYTGLTLNSVYILALIDLALIGRA